MKIFFLIVVILWFTENVVFRILGFRARSKEKGDDNYNYRKNAESFQREMNRLAEKEHERFHDHHHFR